MKSPPRRIALKVFRTAQEAGHADRDFWSALTPEERLVEAWRLSEEQWSLHGKSLMNPDFADLLRAFSEAKVLSLMVGAYALANHSRPRATGDLDILDLEVI